MVPRAVILENGVVVEHDCVERRNIAFANGRVVSHAPDDAARVNLAGHYIYPGLINAHDHLQLNAIPALRHAASFGNSYEWIEEMERHRSRDDVAAAKDVPTETRHYHGALKNLLAGVTLVAHHDPAPPYLFGDDFPVAVLQPYGWCHSLGLSHERATYGPGLRESFRATPSNTPWIIHLAEGIDGIAGSELNVLNDLGCLAENTVLVHGIGLTPAQVTQVLGKGAAVVWCPSSNIGMFGRTLDPRRLFDAHRLALGTDSRLTGARDLLEELRVAASTSDLNACELLRLVTEDAATILRAPDAGSLGEGKRADALILEAVADPFETLLGASRRDVRAVFREGIPVLADATSGAFAMLRQDGVLIEVDGVAKVLERKFARPDALELELESQSLRVP